MALPELNLKQLVDSGLHYGHTTQRWNPLMAPYIFGSRNGIHIIDLEQTLPLFQKAMEVARGVASKGGRILFVGTKAQASDIIKTAAENCGQYYVNNRWLGGMLTNWKTVSQSIKRLKNLEATLESPQLMTKKEILNLTRERDKKDSFLCGVREMGGIPDLIFVIDTNKESIAIQESLRLHIPVIAVVDTNSDPRNITHIIPGNDDAIRSIKLCCDMMSLAILDGLQAGLKASGVDIGEATRVIDNVLIEENLEEKNTKENPIV